MMDIYREYTEKMAKEPENKSDNQSDMNAKAAPDEEPEAGPDTDSDNNPDLQADPSADMDLTDGLDIEPGAESQEEEEPLDTREIISRIKKYIESKGFTYNGSLIENFYLSLKSKPFVILAGISGTGKTRLVKLFAEAIGATSSESGGNGRYRLVSVRPDWSDSSDLFGHTNLKGEFVPGAIIDFVKEAGEHPERPYFLCLDEMNLARVEYYLSDFLSVIETRRWIGDRIVTDQIILDKAAEKEYGRLILPENLYVIGTVNMDETTFPFSRKVLDRANTIEFSDVNLELEFGAESDIGPDLEEDSIEERAEPVPRKNSFLKAKYIVLKTDIKKEQQDLAIRVCGELQAINDILQKVNAHMGYRVRDEIVFYMLNNAEADLLEYNDALDNEIMQKILPRIQGSSIAVKDLLCGLFQKFAGDYSGLNQDMIWKQMEAYMQGNDCVYRNSARKICYMMRRYEEDGFTSYWL
ncbi:MAG: AAA domain-containing protein [Lachnospiraceae bacterium]|nr:AAA domain-containing protein [Lachnospiraceae bacterium]